MKFGVNGQYVLEVLINGRNFPLSNNTFAAFYMVENAIIFLPVIKMVIYDLSGCLIDTYGISDGSLIEVTLGKDQEFHTMYFRCFGTPVATPGPGVAMVTIVGYLDVPKYLFSVYFGGFTGTSYEAIKDIADQCDLALDGDKTLDSMTWTAGRKSFCSFAKSISNHGYVDSKSCMSLAVSFDKTLHYKNVVNQIKQTPLIEIYYGKSSGKLKSTFPALVYSVKSLSGVFNKSGGYGYKVNQEKQDGTYQENKNVNATKMSNYFELNSSLKSSVGVAGSEYTPPDCGNAHDKYEVAYHQNKRIRSTFSTIVEPVIDDISGLDLFDQISLNITNQVGGTQNSTYSGNYLVCAKAHIITGNRYFEKLRLITTGKMSNNNKDMT
jgi:hypothetical protein